MNHVPSLPIAAYTCNESLHDTDEENGRGIPPSLHSLAVHYIQNSSLRVLFNSLVLGHFIFILIAYALAAPQAYVALIPRLHGLPVFIRTIVFVVVMSLLVYTLTPAILPPLSVATLIKAILLTALVALTLTRSLSIHRVITSDWHFTALIDPFLMGTIALSGIVNLMPVTFQTCVDSLRKNQTNPDIINSIPITSLVDGTFVFAYRSATNIALLLCYLLNISWAYAVLLVVPQSASSPPLPSSSPFANVPGNVTLENAQALGQISTIPLIQVLQASHDKLNTIVAFLVNVFIAVSLTISFLVMSVGLLHFVDGSINHRMWNTDASAIKRALNSRFARYWVSFAVILLIALLNPAGLLKIMEGVTTLALNLEAGVFVVYMYYSSRINFDGARPHASGFLTSSQAAVVITYLVMYFTTAVLVDVVLYIPGILFGSTT